MANLTFGAGIWAFGRIVDRYATDGYGPERSTAAMLELAARVDGLEHLDINFPFTEDDLAPKSVAAMLDGLGLRARAVTPHLYTRAFARGAFTNPDPAVRRAAKDRVHAAVEAARELDAGYVKFWPGQDGFDIPGQADYPQLWELTVEALGELATAHPETQFAIEYKPKEPRVQITLGNAAKTLLAIQEAGVDNLGIVLDFGHSLMAGEAPAEALQLVHRHGRLVSAELNDNWRGWDDDLPVASVHLFETLEFLLALRRIGWTQPVLLDQFPFREDPVEALSHSIRTIRRLDAVCERVDLDALREAQDRQDAVAAQRVLWSAV
ncbi:sugar phosphate isomerase/epimerase [Streptomyces sp. FIT100]|uniref:sugar phosphate isomerase/epimerase family protein n=1 Tax=Streptomyces sp. FIT100 TaxID=2837956 RepID=UPI0021C573A7|nr:TIM barrel protein [Streptomyces sp. FIT100]UUN30737.1 TIM barrel protein [Streptomyces sp. FIT100]